MCWPTFRGAAYLASSIFIYRGIQVVINMASALITGLKVTYLPISQAEEFLLQLIYFIPLFTSSIFAFMGVESDSYNFVLFSTVALSLTLLLRYVLELAYIYLVNWESFRMKTTCLGLNISLDLCLILMLLCYVSRLLHQQIIQKEILCLIEEQEKEEQRLLSLPKEKTDTNNSQQSPPPSQSTLQPTNESRRVGVGIGQGFGQGVAIHYPCSQPMDMTRLQRPLPSLPGSGRGGSRDPASYKSSKSPSVISEDYESLPRTPLPPLTPCPIATPDYDDL